MTSILRGMRNPVLLLGALSFALLLTLAEAAGVFGAWLSLFVALGLLRYPYQLTRSAADGEPEPPPAGIEDFNPAAAPQYVLHAVLLIALSWLAFSRLGPVTAALTLACATPATIAIMGVTGNLAAALNPLGLFTLVRTLGTTYLWLVASVFGLGVLAAMVGALDVAFLDRFAALYALLITFDASGRALHEHRWELPFVATTATDRREISDRKHHQHEWEEALDRAYSKASEGDTAHCLDQLDALLGADDHRLESYELLLGHVREWRIPAVTMPLAREFISRLVSQDQVHRAMEVTEACLRQDPTFRPELPAGAAVAAYARSVGHESTAALLQIPASD